jgi:hypothetical protein
MSISRVGKAIRGVIIRGTRTRGVHEFEIREKWVREVNISLGFAISSQP